jgi:hypothetical protein
MLTQFGPDIWIVDGPDVVAALGFRYPTRMAVIRLAGGALFVWSPVALTAPLRAAVDTLGEVRHLVAPNALHDLYIGDWKDAYPGARAYAVPGLSRKRKDIAFDGELGNGAVAPWAGEIDQVVVPNALTDEVVFFHAASGTAILTDLIQQLPQGWYSGWRALVARLDLMVSPVPSVPRKFRLGFTDRRAARAAIATILAWPIQKVLMAHGTPVREGGQAALGRAFGWLKLSDSPDRRQAPP